MSSPASSPTSAPANCGLEVFWDERLISYDFGPGHPLNPVRVELTMALARELGVLDRPNVRMSEFDAADDKLLRLVHEEPYIAAVKHAGATGLPEFRHGLGTSDNPVFIGMHDASALVAGATVAAAEAVWTGRSEHALNISGGLHHAMAGCRQRVLRLQRPCRRDRVAAGERRRARRLRRHRRPPRRRRPGRLLRRPPRADHQHA